MYAEAKFSFVVKGKKGFCEDSIKFVKLAEIVDEAIITPSEWLTADLIKFS